MKKGNEILILGAGVSGLSTGIVLLQKGYKVIIWAKDLPPNTTSNKAAAFWYPFLCNPKDKAAIWAKTTLDYIQDNIIKDVESGCIKRMVSEVFAENVEDAWWGAGIDSYRKLYAEELPQGYIDGYHVEGILMDTSMYMDYLLNKFKQLQGMIIQKTVEDIADPLQKYSIIVNCTGLGSRKLFNDEKLFPVRGQMVKIKQNGFDHVIADDEGPNSLAVIIPRLHDIVLGGTIQKDNWSLEVDPKDTQDILRKCALLDPLFKHVEIIEEYVGLRPARDAIRLEIEDYSGKYIIHNYGHGGAGFTLSWGCAKDVLRLVETL